MHRLMVLTILAALPAAHGQDYTVYRLFSTAPVKLVVPGRPGAPAYLQDAKGEWVEVKAASAGEGAIAVSVRPDMVKDGATSIVVNKPAWVELNDMTPPTVTAVEVNGKAIDLAAGKLSSIAPGDVVMMKVEDEQNRIAAAKCRVLFDGSIVAGEVLRAKDNPKRGSVSFTVPKDCSFGPHKLVLEADDEAPAQNVARRKIEFGLFGVEIDDDGRWVKLNTSEFTYTSKGEKGALLVAPFVGNQEIRLAIIGKGGFQHTEAFITRPELVVNEPDRKVVRVRPGLYLNKATEPSDDWELTLDLEVRRGFPGLLVTSVATTTIARARGYQFWSGFPAGSYYIGSDGKRYEWHPRYADIKPQGWIYLPAARRDGRGYGVISSGILSEYLGDSLLIFTRPKNIMNMKPGDAMRVKFAVVPAAAPAEVGQRAEEIASWLAE